MDKIAEWLKRKAPFSRLEITLGEEGNVRKFIEHEEIRVDIEIKED